MHLGQPDWPAKYSGKFIAVGLSPQGVVTGSSHPEYFGDITINAEVSRCSKVLISAGPPAVSR